ncbi:MAG: serine/threonine protein kinase, partial [Planctomycetes bacterium]|nr:serine/threonine protein kinase [Planctomycetota bacterium]
LCYLVMEFVHGKTARRYQDEALNAGRKGLEERTALEICAAAGKGLEAAHHARIIHRDVKPENILIPFAAGQEPDFSRSKLMDLGIARSDEIKDGLTGTRMSLGTPGYMAPEQAVSCRQAGPAADVFGMAATLYSLLAGRPPFKESTDLETVMATVQAPHAPISLVRGEISRPTGTLLERALQKDPACRPANGLMLVRSLEICLEALGQKEPAQELAVRRI